MSNLRDIHNANSTEAARRAYKEYECTGKLLSAIEKWNKRIKSTKVEKRLINLQFKRRSCL